MVISTRHSKYNLSWLRYLLPVRINLLSEDVAIYKWLR